MSFTYTWEITGLKIKDQKNVEGNLLPKAVCQTYWKLTGTDENGNEGSFSGATPFTAEQTPLENFKNFEELQEDDVLSWIKNVVNNDATYKQHIDEQIQKQIDDELEEEMDQNSLPWAAAREAEKPSDESDLA